MACFLTHVSTHVAEMFSGTIDVSIPVLILNDLSQLAIRKYQKIIVFASLTAAKELIVMEAT